MQNEARLKSGKKRTCVFGRAQDFASEMEHEWVSAP